MLLEETIATGIQQTIARTKLTQANESKILSALADKILTPDDLIASPSNDTESNLTPIPATETLMCESDNPDVIIVSATAAKSLLALFEASRLHELEKIFEEDFSKFVRTVQTLLS